MKRYIIAALAALTLLAIPATASASVSGAEVAVANKVARDNGNFSMPGYVDCYKDGNKRYGCYISYRWRGNRYLDACSGSANVKQVGNRYRVSYNIYWGDC